ncbi:hypothetical protein [Streptomyces sp. Root431]|uniref:hypothetical protein n=1 Tax=Streptomyces sp. Root431 TaxID=1736535 RepID=UPI001F5B3E45|nr:hypothetical protein [Streptomyces sp. Root431]
MKSEAPCADASSWSPFVTSAPTLKVTASPAPDRCSGRGRSVGSSSGSIPARFSRQYPS